MFKKITYIFSIFIFIFIITGCEFKRNSMEGIKIYTTNYPTEYITKKLYGSHSSIKSIYPSGTNINNYELTNKQIIDYSNSDLYIFSGLNEKEKNYVHKMRKENTNLKIIDTTLAMEYNYGAEELWLDPSNFLMMAQNIKKGFSEYIDNYYLNNEISKKYENLKIDVSNLDAKITKTVNNSDDKNILVTDNCFKFLTKYGIEINVLNDETINNTYYLNNLLENHKLEYVFVKDKQNLSKNVKDFISNNNLTVLNFDSLSVLSEDDANDNKDYFDVMNENIELLKSELYK